MFIESTVSHSCQVSAERKTVPLEKSLQSREGRQAVIMDCTWQPFGEEISEDSRLASIQIVE